MMCFLTPNPFDLGAADEITPQRCCAVSPCMRTVFDDTPSWDAIASASLSVTVGQVRPKLKNKEFAFASM